MKGRQQDEFERLWERTRISPTNKLKELKGGKNKTLKINQLLQTPLLLSESSQGNRSAKPTGQLEGRISQQQQHQKESNRTSNPQESSTRNKRQQPSTKQPERNIYREMLSQDLRSLQEYRQGIGRYEQSQPSLKWPYLFCEAEPPLDMKSSK